MVNSEFYAGWFVVWGQNSQNIPSKTELIDTADYMYHLGANINFYMFHGGTNFGYWNGAGTTAPVRSNTFEKPELLLRNKPVLEFFKNSCDHERTGD